MQLNLKNHRANIFEKNPFDVNKTSVIFVPGAGMDHRIISMFNLENLYDQFNILGIDLPGHGASEGPPLKSIEDMADWISDVISSVGYEEASLVGHSQGCLVLLECASRYPEKIKSLSLMGGAGAIPMNPELLNLAEEGNPKAVELMMDWAHGPGGHFGGHPVPGLHHMNLGATIVKNGSVKVLGVDFRACDNYKNGFEAAKNVKCPTINILGDKDKMCPLKEGKKLASSIENSEVEVIKNCGHMILLEEADQALSILKGFVKENHPPN